MSSEASEEMKDHSIMYLENDSYDSIHVSFATKKECWQDKTLNPDESSQEQKIIIKYEGEEDEECWLDTTLSPDESSQEQQTIIKCEDIEDRECWEDTTLSPDESSQEQKMIIKNEDVEDEYTRSSGQVIGEELESSKNFLYEKTFVKNYSSSFDKEQPIGDINDIFRGNFLQFEKINFHQNIVNNIARNTERNEVQDLQRQYIARLRNIVSLETFSCLLCNYQTIHKENLRSHLLLIHKQDMEVKIFKCTLQSCDFKAHNFSDLKTHQLEHEHSNCDNNSHSDTKPLSTFKSKKNNNDNVKVRMNKRKKKKRSGKTKYFCKLCDLVMTGREFFLKHNATHKDPNNPNRYLCYICNHASSKSLITKHLLKVHAIETKGFRDLNVHQCKRCDYRTDLKSSLTNHMIIHKSPDEVEWLKCPHCEFVTKHRVSLRGHMKNHEPNQEGRRKFICAVCSKSFEKKQNLANHILTHRSIEEVDEIYRCADCSYQTKFRGHLMTHVQCHQEAKYVCDICGFRTKRRDTHKIHLTIHKDKSELSLFKCTLCPYETRFKHGLKKHLASSIHTILALRASKGPGRKRKRKKAPAKDANFKQAFTKEALNDTLITNSMSIAR